MYIGINIMNIFIMKYKIGRCLFFFFRLLKLRNMPFVTGRRFNWFSDILPVADEATESAVNITEGT